MGISLSINSPPTHSPLLSSFVVYPSLLPWIFIHGSLSCLSDYYSRRLRALRQNGYYIVYLFHPLNLPYSSPSSSSELADLTHISVSFRCWEVAEIARSLL